MSPKIEITLEAPFTPDNLQEFLSDIRNNGIDRHEPLTVVHSFSPSYERTFTVDGEPVPNIHTSLRAVSE